MRLFLQRLCKSGCCWLWLSAIVWSLDQWSKQWIIHQLAWQECYPLFPGFNLVHIYNPGAAFSFLANQPGCQRWLTAASVMICVGILLDLARKPAIAYRTNIAYALIIGGALGNITDRYCHGAVIDFLDFYLAGWHWPAFNLADSAICLGCVLLLWSSFHSKH